MSNTTLTLLVVLLGSVCTLLGVTLTAAASQRLQARRHRCVTPDADNPLCLGCGHSRVAHRDTGCRHTTDGLRCACDAVLGFPRLNELDLRPRRALEEADRG